MKTLYLLLLTSLILSCTNNNTYSYIQTNEYEGEVIKDEPVEMTFKNDSLAYTTFYDYFYLKKVVSEGVNKKDNSYSRKSFRGW